MEILASIIAMISIGGIGFCLGSLTILNTVCKDQLKMMDEIMDGWDTSIDGLAMAKDLIEVMSAELKNTTKKKK